MPLTTLAVRNVKPAEKPFKIADGRGLYLMVQPTGARLWRYDFRLDGKRRTMALGAYPDVSLAQARDAHAAAWKKVKGGEDPIRQPVVEAHRERARETFASLAARWFALRSPAWDASYGSRVWARIENDVLAEIGGEAVGQITKDRVLKGLRRISDRGAHELARRIRGQVQDIFELAVSEDTIVANPAAGLLKALPKPHAPKPRAALRASVLPDFYRRLAAYDGEEVTRLALLITIQTMLRTEEARFAHDDELEDLDGPAPLWRIPPERMKVSTGRGEHLIPLAPQTVRLIRRSQEIRWRPGYLFPQPTRTGVISENRMIYALYRMGYHGKATVHGFRKTASTVLNESGRFQGDWIEVQLAHIDRDQVRAIYNSAQYLPQRRAMLQWWADYLDDQAGIAALL